MRPIVLVCSLLFFPNCRTIFQNSVGDDPTVPGLKSRGEYSPYAKSSEQFTHAYLLRASDAGEPAGLNLGTWVALRNPARTVVENLSKGGEVVPSEALAQARLRRPQNSRGWWRDRFLPSQRGSETVQLDISKYFDVKLSRSIELTVSGTDYVDMSFGFWGRCAEKLCGVSRPRFEVVEMVGDSSGFDDLVGYIEYSPSVSVASLPTLEIKNPSGGLLASGQPVLKPDGSFSSIALYDAVSKAEWLTISFKSDRVTYALEKGAEARHQILQAAAIEIAASLNPQFGRLSAEDISRQFGDFESLAASYRRRFDALSKEQKTLIDQRDRAQAAAAEALLRQRQLQIDLDSARDASGNIDELQAELAAARRTAEEAVDEKDDAALAARAQILILEGQLAAAQGSASRVDDLAAQLQEASRAVQEAQDQAHRFADDLAGADIELQSALQAKDELQQKVAELETLASHNQARILAAEKDKEQLLIELAGFEQLKSKPAVGGGKTHADLEAQIAELNRQLDDQENLLEDAVKEKEALRVALARANAATSGL